MIWHWICKWEVIGIHGLVRDHIHFIHFSIIRKPHLKVWNEIIHQFLYFQYIFNTMVVEDLANQGTRTSYQPSHWFFRIYTGFTRRVKGSVRYDPLKFTNFEKKIYILSTVFPHGLMLLSQFWFSNWFEKNSILVANNDSSHWCVRMWLVKCH